MKSTWIRMGYAAALAALVACSQSAGTGRSESKTNTPEGAYEQASDLLERNYYEQAIEQLERLRNTFPFSQYAVRAELDIADALFEKGDYAEAAEAYRTFVRLHPRHDRVDYAAFRVGLALFEAAPESIDRDQTNVRLALEELRGFLEQHPDSEHVEKASDLVARGRERLAQQELYVGRFYMREQTWKAAIARFDRAVSRYPETDAAREALLLLGKSHHQAGNLEDAARHLKDFIERYPEADGAAEARQLLRQVEKRGASVRSGSAADAGQPAAHSSAGE